MEVPKEVVRGGREKGAGPERNSQNKVGRGGHERSPH